MAQQLTLVAHCTALLCCHLPEVLEQCADHLHALPLSTKAALLASVRRSAVGFEHQPGERGGRSAAEAAAAAAEVDRCVLALVDASQTTLDLAGLPISDVAAVALAPRLARVHALDVRRCPLLTAHGLRALLGHTDDLRVLRWGGSAASDRAARGALAALLPSFASRASEGSWESATIGVELPTCSAPLLQFLVWPEVDARSAARLARCCPRIRLLQCPPQHSQAVLGDQAPRSGAVPVEADVTTALDAPVLQALSPLLLTDASSSATALPSGAFFVPECVRQPRPHIAVLFRLAYEARDRRLAPKRARNARQRERREQARMADSAALSSGVALAALYRANLLPWPDGGMAGLCICDL